MGHYAQAKVYCDGSHYIAIPHTERFVKPKPKPPEEIITVSQEDSIEDSAAENVVEPSLSSCDDNLIEFEEVIMEDGFLPFEEEIKPKKVRKITKKELFNELYDKLIDLKKSERKKRIVECMLPYFENIDDCKYFVSENFERKQRNLICRRVRMVRKANLARFNYFCTFTYDDNLHSEDSFKKKLRTCLRNFCHRKNWKYMGVWERAPETNRLHFHGLFTIPEGEMVGKLEEHSDYSFSSHKRTTTIQNTFFNKKFGRSDFKPINKQDDLNKEISYIMKYIEKSGEKIVYSKGLYQYFISDILDDDIVTTIGQEDKKLLLFDDFMCLDEGVLMGKVSPEVIEQMRKCN